MRPSTMDRINPLGESFFFDERLEWRLAPRGLGNLLPPQMLSKALNKIDKHIIPSIGR